MRYKLTDSRYLRNRQYLPSLVDILFLFSSLYSYILSFLTSLSSYIVYLNKILILARVGSTSRGKSGQFMRKCRQVEYAWTLVCFSV